MASRPSSFVQATRAKEYRDIDLNFTANPLTGDISTLKDIDAVKAAVRNIILTRFGEKPFNYLFGSRVTSLLFENFDTLTLVSMRNEIRESLTRLEPRIVLNDVLISKDEDLHTLRVNIAFSLRNRPDERIDFSFFLERVR